jgi:HD-like signal output (HDOD) protein
MPTSGQNCFGFSRTGRAETAAAGRTPKRASLHCAGLTPMKQRSLLNAKELTELHESLGRRLDSIGIDSQPEVALQLLDLSKNKDAQLRDYAAVIKTDPAISGRVLKLANSAMFAQRSSVSSLERGCTLLGIERLKAVSLGFHLSKAANTKDASLKDLSRKVWGQSVFRACMAAQTAKLTAPSLVAEAFVIGLMMDAGIPLAAKLQGEAYVAVCSGNPSPGKLFRLETDTLNFTHIDVMSVLAGKWRFPELLRRPIELHHTRPADGVRDDPLGKLHRIAYVVGLLELDGKDLAAVDTMRASDTGGLLTAQRLLQANDEEMARLIKASVVEYQMMSEVFSEVAAACVDIDELAARVHNCMLECIDEQILESITMDNSTAAGICEPILVHNSRVEIVRDTDGSIVAFVSDATGRRVVSHRLARTGETPLTICESLGLETPSSDEATKIDQRVRLLAA